MRTFDCYTWRDLELAIDASRSESVTAHVWKDMVAERPIIAMPAPHRLNIMFHSQAVIDATLICGSTNVITINGDRQIFIDQPAFTNWHGNGACIKAEGGSDVVVRGLSTDSVYGLTPKQWSQGIAGNCNNLWLSLGTLKDSWKNYWESAVYLCCRETCTVVGGTAINCGGLVCPNSTYFGSQGCTLSVNRITVQGRPPVYCGCADDGQPIMRSAPIVLKSQDSDIVQVRGLKVSGDVTGSLFTGHWAGTSRFSDNDYSGCVMVRRDFRSWLGQGELNWKQHVMLAGEQGSKAPSNA